MQKRSVQTQSVVSTKHKSAAKGTFDDADVAVGARLGLRGKQALRGLVLVVALARLLAPLDHQVARHRLVRRRAALEAEHVAYSWQ